MFTTDYRKNKLICFRKTYPLPRIIKTIQHLEIFQYAAALYINMGYYAISILAANPEMTTIVTKFGKSSYN